MRGILRPASLAIGSIFLFLLLGAGARSTGLASPLAQGNSHYFPETKHTVQGKFWQYWQSHGGLAQQGYPISDEFTEISDLNGKPYTVQYFERAVFELHPENAGTPYEILLSQLGTFRLNEKYPGNVVAQPAAGEVGSATGQNALEVVGQSNQNGATFTGFGYLTHISGLSDDLLFTDPANRSEATAKFTYYGTAQLSARSVISTVHSVVSFGNTAIYFDEHPNRNFNNPDSFKTGAQIATYTVRYQDILRVIAPNQGLSAGTGDHVQRTVTGFTLGGQQYRLGRPGLMERMSFAGQAVRTEPNAPQAVEFGAGNLVVTGQGAP